MHDRKLFDSHYTQVSKSLIDRDIFCSSELEFRHLSDCLIYSIRTTDEYGEATGRHHDIRMVRRFRNDKSQYWNKLFEFLQKYIGKNIDELIILRNTDH